MTQQPTTRKRPALPAIPKRPECPTHGDTMRCRCSTPAVAYYYCSVLGCELHSKSIQVAKIRPVGS